MVDCYKIILRELGSCVSGLPEYAPNEQIAKNIRCIEVLLRILKEVLYPRYRDYVCVTIFKQINGCGNKTARSMLVGFIKEQAQSRSSSLCSTIGELVISKRTEKILDRIKIVLIGELTELGREEFKRKIGRENVHTIKEVEWALGEEGFSWGSRRENWFDSDLDKL